MCSTRAPKRPKFKYPDLNPIGKKKSTNLKGCKAKVAFHKLILLQFGSRSFAQKLHSRHSPEKINDVRDAFLVMSSAYYDRTCLKSAVIFKKKFTFVCHAPPTPSARKFT